MSLTSTRIVLFQPDIPWNTGAIGRTCVALDAELILIHPIGFSLDEKGIKRAGMDYWQHVQLSEYDGWDAFIEARQPKDDELFFLSSKTDVPLFDADVSQGGYLVFGSETSGLPDGIHARYPTRFFTMPMSSPHIRSLNLANTATAVIYEALRQQHFQK